MAGEFLAAKGQIGVSNDIDTKPDAIRRSIMVHGALAAAPMCISENHARTIALAKRFDALRLVGQKKDSPIRRLSIDNVEVILKADLIIGFPEFVGTPDVYGDNWSGPHHVSAVEVVDRRGNVRPELQIFVSNEAIQRIT